MPFTTELTVHTPRHEPYVTFRVDTQLFGLPVASVRDVLRAPMLTPVPLAPPVIAGLLHRRGEILTVLDMRQRLGLPSSTTARSGMLIVIQQHHERIALLVDSIVDVVHLAENEAEDVPSTLSENWQQVASKIHKRGKELILVLGVPQLLDPALAETL